MSQFAEGWVSNPDETRGPLISTAAWSMFGAATVFLFTRYWIRITHAKLWLDDLIIGISWLFLLVQVIMNQLNINLGFGKHALDVKFANFERITYYGASGLTVSTIAITLSKISFGVTLLKLTDGWTRYYVYFAIANLAIFAIPTAVIPWTLCKPITKTFIDIIPGTCVDKTPSLYFARFQAIWSAIMDISLALVPWQVLWNLQMRLPEKIGVGIAMSLGILAGATAIVRGHYVEQLTKQDLSYDAVNSVLWSIAETAMTIVATSIPVLRVFFKRAIGTAREKYSSSDRTKKTNTANAASTFAQASARRAIKRSTHLDQSFSSNNSMADVLGGSKNYMELDDIIIDENSGRITASVPYFPRRSTNTPYIAEQDVSKWRS